MERRAITIAGIVQGVGFRPFVFRLATAKRLNGFVRNTAGSVYIEVEGPRLALNDFLECVRNEAPTLARIESVEWRSVPVRHVDDFSITESSATCGEQQCLSPDVAVCPDCLAELFDPKGIDIMRAVRSFDPCLPCGVHMYTGGGKLLGEVRHAPMFGLQTH
jgi:hydrogenase maturation protein HypF